jgi:hypothetical protein
MELYAFHVDALSIKELRLKLGFGSVKALAVGVDESVTFSRVD